MRWGHVRRGDPCGRPSSCDVRRPVGQHGRPQGSPLRPLGGVIPSRLRSTPQRAAGRRMMAETTERQGVRFQADERPPRPLTAGLALQYAVLTIAGIVLTPAVVIRGAGLGDGEYLTWAVFAALLISGTTTVIQAVRLGRIGSGYILLMGTSGGFHRGLRHCPGGWRAGDAGDAGGHLLAVPVPAWLAAGPGCAGSSRRRWPGR